MTLEEVLNLLPEYIKDSVFVYVLFITKSDGLWEIEYKDVDYEIVLGSFSGAFFEKVVMETFLWAEKIVKNKNSSV